MNERIKELADQAFDTAEYPANQQYRIEPNSAFCKKFAELIVQECRDMFVVGSVSWNLLNEKLEHFGVEE
jgi:hypothetical protein